MEIENLAGRSVSKAQREQRQEDLSEGACFKCHKAGCRPWKCNSSRINNVGAGIDSVTEGGAFILSDSEKGRSSNSKL